MSIHRSIASVFDWICFEYGDNDAILTSHKTAFGYSELQQLSIALACQLLYRYRPTHVVLELQGHAAAEAVSMLACNRIGVPFIPISVQDYRIDIEAVASTLRNCKDTRLVAVVRCNDDLDPILAHFQRADIHNVVFVSDAGDLLQPMNVPQTLPSRCEISDDLYILFTSGTSGNLPKAVIGSQSSTLARLHWFAETFPPAQGTIVARRSKLTFVDAITELFSSLLFPPSVLYAFDPQELASRGVELILNSPCTQVTMLQTQLEQLLLLAPPQTHSLQTIIVSGEPCKACVLPKFQQAYPNTKLVNLYGQTESTGDVLCAVLSEMENPIVSNVVAVGRPILPEIKVTLTGRNELVIEGNLSNGYLNSLNPLTCFHTGDSGFCHDGVWYVTGRVDDVVKINGHFVSPVQVETCFTQVFSEPCAAAIVNMSVYALVESNRFVFEREIMRDSGIPWHLIPKRVFFIPTIPKQGGGAGKVDCASVKQIIEDFLNTTTASVSDDKDPLVSILSSVLGVTVELDKSFVEMGGDSALAITLLYKLRMAGLASVDVPVADILESMNVQNLSDILSGDVVPKRRKVLQQVDSMEPFVVQDIKRFSDCHFAIEFKACVDASPLVNGTDVFGACQGGIIQKIACHKVVACHQLTGWQVQAGMIIVNDLLIVCGYNNDGESGIIVALTLDLRMTKWARHVQGQIKSTPIVMRDQLWVVAGAMLIILDPVDGKEISSLQFPSKTESRPAVCIGLSCVVYGFADWDTGLGIVNDMGTLITTVHAENVSPVYADLLQLDSKRVAVCDIQGVIHDFNIDSLEIKSTRVASKPIFSGPIQVDDSVIFGCHDGIVRCIKASNFSEKLWEYDAQSVVYSSPLAVPGDCFVVCTTAGDIIQIRKGTEEWRMMVPGEIWSNPIIIGVGGNIAVGARDSRVHIIRQITNGPV